MIRCNVNNGELEFSERRTRDRNQLSSTQSKNVTLEKASKRKKLKATKRSAPLEELAQESEEEIDISFVKGGQ